MALWAAMYVVYNEADYIQYSIRSVSDCVDHILVLRTAEPWNGPALPLDDTSSLVRGMRNSKVTLVEGAWTSESEQRTAALNLAREFGCEYGLIVDGDEVYESAQLHEVLDAIETDLENDMWTTTWWTYWKSPLWRIEPPEPFRPPIAIRITDAVTFPGLRHPTSTRSAEIPAVEPFLHHFSYAKPSNEIWEKIHSFGHASEILPEWWEDVWLAWDDNHELENLHPTNPECYPRAVYRGPEHLPEPMRLHPFVVRGVNGLHLR